MFVSCELRILSFLLFRHAQVFYHLRALKIQKPMEQKQAVFRSGRERNQLSKVWGERKGSSTIMRQPQDITVVSRGKALEHSRSKCVWRPNEGQRSKAGELWWWKEWGKELAE